MVIHLSNSAHSSYSNSKPDYGESHYIGPIKGAQPNSQAWVDGFEHTPWLHLSAFFARAFKDGHYPRIEKFRVYAWARPHRRDANIGRDTVGRPTGWQLASILPLYLDLMRSSRSRVKS